MIWLWFDFWLWCLYKKVYALFLLLLRIKILKQLIVIEEYKVIDVFCLFDGA